MEFCVVKLAKNTLFYQTDNKNKKKYQKNKFIQKNFDNHKN
jgi:hypothetical protein